MLKKCELLLSSMAIRASTDYGFRRSEEKALFINQMSDLYDAFKEGKTDKDIAQMLNYDELIIKHIREEVDGKGYYH